MENLCEGLLSARVNKQKQVKRLKHNDLKIRNQFEDFVSCQLTI